MTVAELREKLAAFKDEAQVWMLFDAPYRIETHSIENVTTTPHYKKVFDTSKEDVYLEWRCG